MTDIDWHGWHAAYDDDGSGLALRLRTVQRRIGEWLDRAPAPADGPLRVLSMCAGQGRDVIEALRRHPRRDEVHALLVELDDRNVAVAREAAAAAGLDGVEVRQGDASLAAAYADVVPAHLAVVAGVLGNMTDADVEGLVRLLPMLLAPGGTVVWTRHTGAPDLTPAVRRWFAEAGFRELSFDTAEGYRFSVGVHELDGQPVPFDRQARLFVFRGACTPDETVRHLG